MGAVFAGSGGVGQANIPDPELAPFNRGPLSFYP
jgi:hypothetical protein